MLSSVTDMYIFNILLNFYFTTSLDIFSCVGFFNISEEQPLMISSHCDIQVNGCLLDPVPPVLVRKGCQSLPSNMMETSIDEGLETEGEAEEDPSQAFDAFQSTRSGQRRHTLSEVTNQMLVVPGSGRTASAQHTLLPQSPRNRTPLLRMPPTSYAFLAHVRRL